MGRIMASVPMAELQALSKMDDYDRMLAMDRVARQYGVSVANLEKQLQYKKFRLTTTYMFPQKHILSLALNHREVQHIYKMQTNSE